MRTAALIVAAGQGLRAGGMLPKQFAPLCGRPMLAHSVGVFASHPGIAGVFVVVGDGQHDLARAAIGGHHDVTLVTGGAERQDSVRAGLAGMAEAGGFDRVLIHDAARPFLPPAMIDALLATLEASTGAIPVLPVVDSLCKGSRVMEAPVGREGLWRVQTPQAFHLAPLLQALDRWQDGPANDEAQVVRAAGYSVSLIEGDAMLEKITHSADFERAEALHAARMVSRTGLGFDVHRLEAGEELWLCGVQVPHDKGLAGHSDADVALHALVDALLGAIGDGDIGAHFPPSDPHWKGAPSSRFVEHARDLVRAAGGIIDHVDVTIICEAPKIGPHRDSMRARVASLLQVHTGQVSIKATTTERLGLTGRGEGIASQAIATVRMPIDQTGR